MLTLNAIRKYLMRVAREEFGAKRFADVLVSPYSPPEGEEGVSATIVLRSQEGYRLSTEQVGNITRQANDFMAANKDRRFVYTHYATTADREELAQLDD
jgi:hypothetical protein